MTTFIPFAWPPNAAFSAQIVLDGAPYTLLVNWGLFGQRPYANLFDQSGNRIFTQALVGSSDPIPISSLSWNGITQQVTLVTAAPHGVPIGAIANLTLSGATPNVYNAVWQMGAYNATTLTFPLASDPGATTVNGTVAANLNLLGGYGFTSTLIFRDSSQNFEVTP